MFKRTQKEADRESGSNYMQQLDAWTDQNVITPLAEAWESWNEDGLSEAEGETRAAAADEAVKKAIREKVLESYRNGQAAGGNRPQRRFSRLGDRK